MADDTDLIAAIYETIIDPSGWDDVVKRIVEATKSVAGGIVIHAEGSGQTLAPHLKRATEVHQLLSRARAATESLGSAVAAAGFAVFLLARDCRVLFANAKA